MKILTFPWCNDDMKSFIKIVLKKHVVTNNKYDPASQGMFSTMKIV